MTAKPCALIGIGGHARVVVDVLRKMGREIAFATTTGTVEPGEEFAGIPVAGDDKYLETCDRDAVDLALGVGAPQSGDLRRTVWQSLSEMGFAAVTLVHPDAIVAQNARLDEGAQIMAGAIVQPGCRIGRGAIVNTGARIDHDCNIGDFVHVAPGATLCGNVETGSCTLIGAGATVIPGVIIGRDCHIAAGSTVTGNLADGAQARLELTARTDND